MQVSVRATLEQFPLAHPAGDGTVTISVASPPGAQQASASVLYVVDADLTFGVAAEIVRVLSLVEALPPLYVVGVGYDAGYSDFLKLRTADLTPPMAPEARDALGDIGATIGAEHNGGADAFLRFLVEVVRPQVAQRYPQTADGDTILFGHSLGGLFAAHALLTRPDVYSAFIVSSPSLWWDGFSILQRLPAFGAVLEAMPRQPRIFVDVGGREQDPPQSVPPGLGVSLEAARAQIAAARMVDAAKAFAEALSDAGATEVRHMAFAEEDHVSVASAAILHGVRFALGRQA